jgi:hypothetical protein
MAEATALLSAQASLSAAGDGSTTRPYNESYAASYTCMASENAVRIPAMRFIISEFTC